MKAPQYYVGIDIASASFTCSVGKMEGRWQIVVRPASFANEYDSFSAYLNWLHDHGLIGNYEDYLALPIAVLEDARLLMEGEHVQAERERRKRGQS